MRINGTLTLTVLGLATFTFAQTSGAIKGVVVDERGKPLPRAHVHIAETSPLHGSRVIRFYDTDGGGHFLIEHIPWGTYAVMAGKEESGYADTKFAFYSNLKAPVVIVAPAFPTADVLVQLGPKAGVVKLSSLTDRASGEKVTAPGAVTLRRLENPNFSMTTSSRQPAILVPSLTDISIEIVIPGYKPWPPAGQVIRQGTVRLKPEEVVNLEVKLEPEPRPSTVQQPTPSAPPQ